MKKTQRKLGRKVLILIIGASSFLTFIFTIVSFAIDFKNEQENMNKTFYFIENTNLASISEAIFSLDEDQIDTQGLGILNHQDVQSVIIEDDQGNTLFPTESIKKKTEEKSKSDYLFIINILPIEGYKEKRVFDLIHEDLNDQVGKITVVLSKDNMYKRLSEKLIIFFITQLLKTMIISSIILLIFSTVVTQHLENMAAFLKNADNSGNEQIKGLFLNRKKTNHEDEIDILQSAINEMYSESLQEKKSILENISQAILIIKESNLVCSVYSPYSHSILELDKIKNIHFTKILSKTSLMESKIGLIIQTLETCIGETSSTFSLNQHHLPRKILYKTEKSDAQDKILETAWDSIVDKSGLVSKILVSFKDVTSIKSIENEFKKKDCETRLLMELAQSNGRVFQKFQQEAELYIHECEKALEKTDQKQLFNVLHTFKGTTQTLGFKEISNCIFDIESYFHGMKGKFENASKQITELDKTKACLENYKAVYQKYFSNEEYHELKYFLLNEDMINMYPISVKKSFNILNDFFDIYLNKIYNTNTLLDETIELSQVISYRLGKQNPVINLTGGNILLKGHIYKKITEILNHLIKNSIDHGIEVSSIRSSNKKPERGIIEIGFSIDNGTLKINYSDDGAGIDIEKLRLKSQDYDSLDEKIVHYIFESQVSTAKSLTDISGRGVGMTAVKSIIESVNGTIGIVLKENKKNGYRQFIFLISMPYVDLSVT
ncbi:MAG: ATP-binding protein [Oligoflexales bacterium]